ncbi:chitoporin [Vibrio aestuarianus]|uniref:Chitoporin n=1 Tax=Vibrio aestuarianus TaxID=28171 RepID=A0A9X4FH23_9VIBR|nr:chitoporin [Vibrio aestuarianus]MDE1311624.1 chitoporin [Vibrio aestuarianus]MDE1332430.1 chitoporin [Vibrio aestuarianus]MDE1357743.1 chitoporin [Vibrio aestuarianus]NGZ17809.1 chitoporin [Vibrio aestuarianus]NGZ91606.1 chitoporin [Vibrio aestuarianus subsp. cardii]
MDKMFKRTLLGAAVAIASTGAFAAGETGQIGVLSDFNVQAYGVAAISAFYQEDSNGYDYENESRIGFRASKDMFDNVNVFMQIESGYVGEDGKGSTLGARDTFLGLQGDWGKLRFGRMLTPLYEIVDWPYSNPGLGRVFDWGGDVAGHYDRKGDIARYDSPSFSGFTFNLSAGRGDVGTKDSNHFGAAVHYNAADIVTVHVGYENNSKYQVTLEKDGQADIKAAADATAYIVGFELPLPAGFGLAGAYKYTEGVSKHYANAGKEAEQGQYSIIAQYWNGPWGVKVGYAANLESEIAGVEQDDADEVLSAQLMYVKNGFVPYLRVGQHDAYNADDKKAFVRVGLEYGF